MARFEETQDLRGVNLDIGEQRARMGLAQRLEQFASQTRAVSAKTAQRASAAVQYAQKTKKAVSESNAIRDAQTKVLYGENGEILEPDWRDTSEGNIDYRAKYNSVLRDRYTSAIKTDARSTINNIAAENKTDPFAYEEKVRAFINGAKKEYDPSVIPDMELFLEEEAARNGDKLYADWNETERRQAEEDVDANIARVKRSIYTAAYDGDYENAQLYAVEEYLPLMQGKLERNEISDESIRRGLDEITQRASFHAVAGDMGRIIRQDGALAAWENLESIKRDRLYRKDLTVEEEKELNAMLGAELMDFFNTTEKVDMLRERELDEVREANFVDLFTRMTSGENVSSAVVQFTQLGLLSPEQGESLNTMNRTTGPGMDDWTVINQMQADIIAGASFSRMLPRIMESSLTGSRKAELLKMAESASGDGGAFTSDPMYKAGREYIKGMLAPEGFEGQFDQDDAKRMAQAQMDYFLASQEWYASGGKEGVSPYESAKVFVERAMVDKSTSTWQSIAESPTQALKEIVRRNGLSQGDPEYIPDDRAERTYNLIEKYMRREDAVRQFEFANERYGIQQ